MPFPWIKLPFSAPTNGLAPQQRLPVTWSTYDARSRSSPPSPFPRSRHTVTANATGELVFFGGRSSNTRTATSDLYVFSTRDLSMTLLRTSGAVPRTGFLDGAVLIDNTLLICGSTSPNFGPQNLVNLDSLYLLNLMSREWSRVVVAGPGPNSRHGHTTTVVDSKLFVFGGNTGTEHMNDMWTLDLNCLKSQPVWESYEPTPGNERPPPRSGHVSVATKDHIIIYGGRDNTQFYNDTWSFDIPTQKWTGLQCTGYVPFPSAFHAAVLVDDVMYVFGGKMASTALVALQLSTQRWFTFDQWGTDPGGRWGHAMAFDGTRVFVIGGCSGQYFGPGYLGDRGEITKSDSLSCLYHEFVTKYIKYPCPEPNVANPIENTTQLAPNSSPGLPTEEQPQYPKTPSSEEHTSYSRLELEQQLSVSLAARDQRIAKLTARLEDIQANLDESILSRDRQIGQHEKELTNMRSMLEANESKLVAVQSRLTDAEKDLAESKADAVALRAQAATGSVNKDEDGVTRMVMELMERVRAIEGETASKHWNEKSIEFMECRNED